MAPSLVEWLLEEVSKSFYSFHRRTLETSSCGLQCTYIIISKGLPRHHEVPVTSPLCGDPSLLEHRLHPGHLCSS